MSWLDAWARRARAASSTRRYSVVSAVYDVEPYLDDFLRSLTRQSLDFDRHIELILVDDGSRDRSVEVIRRWQAEHPGTIRLLRKENGGQASARNLGLEHATGDWVTFIDPDDFVDARYFEHVDALLARPDARDVTLVGCKMLVHRRGRVHDEHALATQFRTGDRIVRGDDPSAPIQLSAASAFFRMDRIRALALRFDEALRPVFEDGLFVGRYRALSAGAFALCASARYSYRKRADASSTIDRSWSDPHRYHTVLERGYLALFREAGATSGRAPKWAQRTVLYELVWYLRMLVDRPETGAFLGSDDRARFHSLFRACLAAIDADTIADFELAGCTTEDRVALLGRRDPRSAAPAHVLADAFDEAKRLVRIRSFRWDELGPEPRYLVGERELAPAFAKDRWRDLLGAPLLREGIAWVRIGAPHETLRVRIGAIDADVEVPRLGARRAVAFHELTRALSARPPRAWHDRLERWVATSPPLRALYGRSIVFIDRDVQADDNAEHLYRHVLRNRPDLRAFFVLRRTSHDWPRLAREGFRLIPFGTLRHRIALLNAAHLVSSHTEHFVLGWPTVRHRRELQRSRFTFLQHGVIKDDLSAWLNTKPIDCLVTASPAEHASIVASGTGYRFTEREVVLTGLPRHDALVDAEHTGDRSLLVMPTWRQWLVGPPLAKTSARAPNPAFFESEFAHRWKRLLDSPALERLCVERGLRVRLFPHANLEPYLAWFDPPHFVDTLSHRETSVQRELARAAVMLTDYSSVAFDMALMRKPVIYYQFDRDRIFGGAHPTRPGYFDYGRDGFGPLCLDEDALLAGLSRVLDTAPRPERMYLERMERALPLRDGRCCERTLQAILDLDRPASGRAEVAPAQATSRGTLPSSTSCR